MSPLGKYGELAATISAVFLIAAFVLGSLFRAQLGIDEAGLESVRDLALIAGGAVFGSAAAFSVKRPIDAESVTRLETAIGRAVNGAVAKVPDLHPPEGPPRPYSGGVIRRSALKVRNFPDGS